MGCPSTKLLAWVSLLLLITSLTAAQSTRDRTKQSASGSKSAAKTRRTTELSGLIKDLRVAGAKVVLGKEKVSQPFFSVPARIMTVNGEGVQVFEYARASTANTEASRVSSNGNTIGTSKPSWIATPHFFKKGKLILIYLGDNQKVLEVFQGVLGNQFAGG
jgi:hypothetical protein